MYRAMVGIGVLCGLLIVSVFQITKPIIARNQAEALRQSIFHVLPEAESSRTYRYTDAGTFEPLGDVETSEPLVYAAFDAANRLTGVAIEAQGMGYQDIIRVLYGYAPTVEAIIGYRVLESRETPGLGTRIETDDVFLKNFERLDVALSADGATVANPITSVKRGAKTQPWEIDAITGATISSVAIASILRESSAVWIPRVRARLDDFESEVQS
jgi:electron transport complex protein RnfG